MHSNMVVFIMFDLPTTKGDEQRRAKKFRQTIITNGYLMLQESVYIKLINNAANYKCEKSFVHKNSPKTGNVVMFKMKLEEFKNVDFIVGKGIDFSIFSDDCLIIA